MNEEEKQELETLRADYRAAHPTQETRLEELEELVAALMFGGEGE